MNDIVFVKEFYDINAIDRANEYLQKGWKLLHVGTKTVETIDDKPDRYVPYYVVGANKQQYDAEKQEFESSKGPGFDED